MRVSRQFEQHRRDVSMAIPASLGAGFMSMSSLPLPDAFCSSRTRAAFIRSLVALNSEQRRFFRRPPARRSEPQAHASLAGRKRKKTSRAKSCSPRIALFRVDAPPASAWPNSCRSRHADRVPRARYLWPLEPNRTPTSGHPPVTQASRYSHKKHLPNKRYNSHIWDFIRFERIWHSSLFLYKFSDALWSEIFDESFRPQRVVEKYLGGQHGSSN